MKLLHWVRTGWLDWLLLAGLLGMGWVGEVGWTKAQPAPAAPPMPAYYQAEVRYRISSARDQHVALFRDLVTHLERLGFQFVPPLTELPATLPADPTQDVLTGRVPATRVLQLGDHPAVAAVLLLPPDYRLPDDPEQLVPVQLELRSGFSPAQQRQLRQQVLVLLQHFGFREAIGYDTRGRSGLPHTRLRGALPANQLRVPFYDLRYQPNGWFGPRLQEPPEPLRRLHPVLLTEVVPGLAVPRLPQLPPERSPQEEKIRDDLWQRLQEPGRKKEYLRIEIILQAPLLTKEWEKLLYQAAPELFLEGRLKQFATVRVPAEQVRALAALPFVSALRLPENPQQTVAPEAVAVGDNHRFLEQTGLASWHRRQFRGQNVRVAVLDSDFRGAVEWIQTGRLPAKTRLLDLTRLHQPELEPAPYPPDGQSVGHGTCCARAVTLAAPDAELILIRLDPQAPYLLREVLDWVRGQEVSSAYLRQRANELYAEAALVRRQWEEVLQERKKVLEDFADEREYRLRYDFLGPVRAWLFTRQEWHQLRLAEAQADQAAYLAHQQRFDQLLAQLRALQGTPLIVCPWVWQVGWPLGQRSPMTEELDGVLRPNDPPFGPVPIRRYARAAPFHPLWLNAAGNSAGQSLAGWFFDPTGDGPLTLLPTQAPLPAGLWTHSLAFLAWQPYRGEKSAELPAGLRLRLALQWTEAHDPAYFPRPGEPDPYLEPLARPRLTVLQQRDPTGKQAPADDFLAVAQTAGRPQRLDYAPDSATYELTLEFQTATAGRYLVQVAQPPAEQWVLLPVEQGQAYRLQRLVAPARDGTRPLEAATLPAIERKWLFTPRLFIEARGGSAALLGRPVWREAATSQGTIGVPADGRYLVAVGAADGEGRPEPYSAPGPPQGLELFLTPRLLVPDQLDLGVRGPALGTSLSAAACAGAAATLLSGGWSLEQVRQFFLGQQRHVLRLPPPP